jgi:hypothetical protein
MKENKFKIAKLIISICLGFLAISQAYAGACNCVCCHCDRYSCARVSYNKKILTPVKYNDKSLLNLKPEAEKSVAATNTAITITQSDFQNIAQSGNSWIDFKNINASFTMNIGTANTSSSQIFTLPSNLRTYFNNYGRLDFVNESSLDAGLQISGADVAARKLLIDNNDNAVYQYFHVAT